MRVSRRARLDARLMVHFSHRANRWEVRCLNTDETLARRRTFAGASEVIDLLIAGDFVVAFPEPYDWAIDGV
jgi:hypothetical protein